MNREQKQDDNIKSLFEFKGSTEQSLAGLWSVIKEIKDNHLYHINKKINALLFTVLGSVFVAVIIGLIAAVKYLVK